MATKNGDEKATVWEGYSDYQKVSHRMAMSIEDAVDAYAALKALHREDARIKADRAASARRHILAAALRLRVEMEPDRDEIDGYDEMLTRWEGEEGFLEKFDAIRLQNTCPSWLDEFAEDIRRAGWELGYLQAGRSVQSEEGDAAEQQATSLLKD